MQLKPERCKHYEQGFCRAGRGFEHCCVVSGTRCIEPITNAEAIRRMSDEELAEFLCGIYDDNKGKGKFIDGEFIPAEYEEDILEWLRRLCSK